MTADHVRWPSVSPPTWLQRSGASDGLADSRQLAIGNAVVDLGMTGDVMAVVGLVWLLHLYNFMDGIDGIAGVEAVTVGLAAAGLQLLHSGGEHWLVPALLAMAAMGFLSWLWPPARIFMGDAGSGFIGLTLGLLVLRAAHDDPAWLWVWLILLGVFVTDATVTLTRRLFGAARIHEAHRDHAYQHAARRTATGPSHSRWPRSTSCGCCRWRWR